MRGTPRRPATLVPGQSASGLVITSGNFQTIQGFRESTAANLMSEQQFDWEPLLGLSASTDIGMRRSNNQDNYSVSLASDLDEWMHRGHLLIVADGMGAHAAGELASKMAVDNVTHAYGKHHEMSPPDRMRAAIDEANGKIHERGESNSDFHNMGTTCSALLLLPHGAIAGHVGDSRIYRWRDGVLHQLTFDHSLVWELQETGKLTEEEIDANAVPKNVITRSLGPSGGVEIDIEGPFAVEVGDKYLICSDGLTGRVGDEELAATLSALSPEQATTFLVDLANLRGGPDNITIVVAEIRDSQLASASHQLEPLLSGVPTLTREPLNPLLLIATLVCALLALAMLATQHYGIAIASVILAVVGAGLVGYHFIDPMQPDPVPLSHRNRLGRGPHREWQVDTAEPLARRLAQMLQSGRQNVEARGWVVDWGEFDRSFQCGIKLLDRGNAGQALSEFANAIHHLADECGQRMRSDPSDTWIGT